MIVLLLLFIITMAINEPWNKKQTQWFEIYQSQSTELTIWNCLSKFLLPIRGQLRWLMAENSNEITSNMKQQTLASSCSWVEYLIFQATANPCKESLIGEVFKHTDPTISWPGISRTSCSIFCSLSTSSLNMVVPGSLSTNTWYSACISSFHRKS